MRSKVLASAAYAQSIALKARETQTLEIEKQLELLSKFGRGIDVETEQRKLMMQLINRKPFEESINELIPVVDISSDGEDE